ncbi:MAG: hypothetical protein MJ025_04585 [Victivallaceae bacterium]|nr:hypothetical protein [Victivallaceae bacterium]
MLVKVVLCGLATAIGAIAALVVHHWFSSHHRHRHGLVVVAASNSPKTARREADYVCKGRHDEVVINHAIRRLPHGGTLRLMDGDYYIDGFDCKDHTAIRFGSNGGCARVINVTGTTENKSYNTRHGVTLHVTEHAFSKVPAGTECRVFGGSPRKPDAEGAFYTYTHVNNVNFENFYIYLPDASRPVVGIDARNFGSSYVRQVGVYTANYFHDRFMHLKPATPVPGCIGFYSCPGSNDEMARIGYDTANAGGLHTGFVLDGVDHLVMKTCTAARCCRGYEFRDIRKTLTVLNSSDEGNAHLPHFSGAGHVSMIDFNIERFNADFMPDDPAGDGRRGATVEKGAKWRGTISYTLQGGAFGLKRFFEPGCGMDFRVTNEDHSPVERPENPEYLETYFDRASNRSFTWNGSEWVDSSGAAAQPAEKK